MYPQHPLSSLALGVNIDHIATLRNVRGTTYPSPLAFALSAQAAGADAITLHLREDRRHIRESDVLAIQGAIAVRMNLEIAVTAEMVDFACQRRPADVCLVPERRAELTTEGGLDVVGQFDAIRHAVERLGAAGIRVSLFIAPDPEQVVAAARCGAAVVELHTGSYAEADAGAQPGVLKKLQVAARQALGLGLAVHAGHGLTPLNTAAVAAIPEITELNIGHAIVARALDLGWVGAITEIRSVMEQGRALIRRGQ